MKRLAGFFCLIFCVTLAGLTSIQATPINPPVDDQGYQILFDAREAHGPSKVIGGLTDDDSGYDVTHYNVEIRFEYSTESVSGHVDMSFTCTAAFLTEAALHLQNNMIVDGITVDGVPTTYSQSNPDGLTVDLPTQLVAGDDAVIAIDYHGTPISGYMGSLSFDTHQGQPIISSLSEPEGARTWWPCKDIPADKATARMVWTVPSTMTATSNGLLNSVTVPEPGWKSYEWIENYPITTYLIAVTATNFAMWSDWYVTASNDSLPLYHYIYPEDSLDSRTDFADLPDVIAFFVSIYGEYPFMEEKYGHSEFPWGGAMEHQTLTSYGQSLINGYNTYHWIMVHELSHQWWGDLVTCETWMDIWLNEGFATYSDALWTEFDEGWTAYQNRMASFRTTYFQEDNYNRFPIYDPDNLWGGTVYQKGAWLLHMLRYVLGDSFWDFFYEWRAQFSFDAVTTAELQETLESVSGTDLDWYFGEWVYMAGYPEYQWGWQSEPLGSDSSTVTLRIEQVQDLVNQTPIFIMPIEIGVTTTTGYEVHTVQNDIQTQYFNFNVDGNVLDVAFDPDIWILKTSSEVPFVSPPQVDVEVTYVSGSPIPASGGNLIYDLYVINNEPTPVDYDGWLEAAYENGVPNTLILRSFTNYQPGWTINRPGTYYPVPSTWAAGNYTFIGKVGQNPDVAWDQSSFPFVKEGANFMAGFQPSPVSDAPNPFEIIDNGPVQASDYDLLTVYPNPFNPTTTINFSLQADSEVKLSVYDIAGRQVASLIDGVLQSGYHQVTFDASDLASGIYFTRLETNSTVQMKKMALVK